MEYRKEIEINVEKGNISPYLNLITIDVFDNEKKLIESDYREVYSEQYNSRHYVSESFYKPICKLLL